MYTVNVPFTDYKNQVQNKSVSFNLDTREVFKLLPEFLKVNKWMEENKKAAEEKTLPPEEVLEFYNALEAIMLEAYGEVSDDGLYFRKSGRYEFEESAMFNAIMMMFVKQPQEATKMLDGLLPKELFDIVKNADAADLARSAQIQADDKQAEIERLQAQLRAARGE